MDSKPPKLKEIKGRVPYEVGRRFDGACYIADITMQEAVVQAVQMWVAWAEEHYGIIKIEKPSTPTVRRVAGK